MPHTILRPHHPSNGFPLHHHYTQNGHAKTNGHGGEFKKKKKHAEVMTHLIKVHSHVKQTRAASSRRRVYSGNN